MYDNIPEDIRNSFDGRFLEALVVTGYQPFGSSGYKVKRISEDDYLCGLYGCLVTQRQAVVDGFSDELKAWIHDCSMKLDRFDTSFPKLIGRQKICDSETIELTKLSWMNYRPFSTSTINYRVGYDRLGIIRFPFSFSYLSRMPFMFMKSEYNEFRLPSVFVPVIHLKQKRKYAKIAELYLHKKVLPVVTSDFGFNYFSRLYGDWFLVRPNTYDNDLCWVFEHRISRFLPEDMSDMPVVDINPQCGYFSRFAHDRGAIVFAYEPMDFNRKIIKRNIIVDDRLYLIDKVSTSLYEEAINLHVPSRLMPPFIPHLCKRDNHHYSGVCGIHNDNINEVLSRINPAVVNVFAPYSPELWVGGLDMPSSVVYAAVHMIRRADAVEFYKKFCGSMVKRGFECLYASTRKSRSNVWMTLWKNSRKSV